MLADPEDTNHAGRVYRVYDGAGVATTVAFDFKGHPTSEQRQLVTSKTDQPDWSDLLGESTIAAMATAASSLLDAETFTASSERDALGRVLRTISPDDSEVLYSYDEGGGLQKVELKHRGSDRCRSEGVEMMPQTTIVQHDFDSAKSASGRTIRLERHFRKIAGYWAKTDEELIREFEFSDPAKAASFRAAVGANPFVHLGTYE